MVKDGQDNEIRRLHKPEGNGSGRLRVFGECGLYATSFVAVIDADGAVCEQHYQLLRKGSRAFALVCTRNRIHVQDSGCAELRNQTRLA